MTLLSLSWKARSACLPAGSACTAISLVTQANAATVMPLGPPALVSGWGNTVTEGEVFQPYLQWVQLSITGCTSGSALYASSDVTGNMFCAGVPNYDKDSLSGRQRWPSGSGKMATATCWPVW